MSGPELESIEAGLRATRGVGSVVKALWALSRAQIPRVEASIDEASAYLEGVDALIDRVAGPPIERSGITPLHVILGPERSFCGTLAARILDQVPETGALGLVGARLIETAHRIERLRRRVVFSIHGASSEDELGAVAQRLAAQVLDHAATHSVRLHYTVEPRVELRTALLISDRAPSDRTGFNHFSPLGRIVAEAVRESLSGHLQLGLANTLGVELRWRIAATERARAAIEERQQELERARRTHLQESVTRELGELSASLLAEVSL